MVNTSRWRRRGYRRWIALFCSPTPVYEVMPVYVGRPFRFVAHCERLAGSLAQLGMEDPYTRAQWHDLIATLIERNAADNPGPHCYVYWQVTRGTEYGRNHAPLPKLERTVFCVLHAPDAAGPDGARARRKLRDGGGQPLGPLRHQIHRAARQYSAARTGGTGRRRGDNLAARRAADRRVPPRPCMWSFTANW